MAIQRAHFGTFGQSLACDQFGFVPTFNDGPWDLFYLHDEPTHDAAGELTDYGRLWEEFGWPATQLAAAEQLAVAQSALSDWRRKLSSRKI